MKEPTPEERVKAFLISKGAWQAAANKEFVAFVTDQIQEAESAAYKRGQAAHVPASITSKTLNETIYLMDVESRIALLSEIEFCRECGHDHEMERGCVEPSECDEGCCDD